MGYPPPDAGEVDAAVQALAKEIRRRREQAGLSHAELALAIQYSRDYVGRAERPRKGLPSAALVAALDDALDARGALIDMHNQALAQRLTSRHAQRATTDHREQLGPPGSMVDPMPRLLGRDNDTAVDRSPRTPHKRFRQSGDYLETSIERSRRIAISSPAYLDEILIHFQEQWHSLVRTDNLLGPRFAIVGVLSQIAAIEELCSSLRGLQRLKAVRLGAQYAESAAWLYEDSGNMVQARHWTSRAMELAYECDDERMLAWAIFRRSQQAAAARDITQVIGFSQAARRNEEQLATPTRAAIRVQEAYGHALDGNERAAQTLLDEAHTWAANDSAGDAREGHGSYCTPSYIEIQRANCWLVGGKRERAIVLYEQSLQGLSVVYQRSRAAALSQLAVAYASNGQLDQAARAARAALPVARSGGSMRIVEEIVSTGRGLAPHKKIQEVAALLHELESSEGSQ